MQSCDSRPPACFRGTPRTAGNAQPVSVRTERRVQPLPSWPSTEPAETPIPSWLRSPSSGFLPASAADEHLTADRQFGDVRRARDPGVERCKDDLSCPPSPTLPCRARPIRLCAHLSPFSGSAPEKIITPKSSHQQSDFSTPQAEQRHEHSQQSSQPSQSGHVARYAQAGVSRQARIYPSPRSMRSAARASADRNPSMVPGSNCHVS